MRAAAAVPASIMSTGQTGVEYPKQDGRPRERWSRLTRWRRREGGHHSMYMDPSLGTHGRRGPRSSWRVSDGQSKHRAPPPTASAKTGAPGRPARGRRRGLAAQGQGGERLTAALTARLQTSSVSSGHLADVAVGWECPLHRPDWMRPGAAADRSGRGPGGIPGHSSSTERQHRLVGPFGGGQKGTRRRPGVLTQASG